MLNFVCILSLSVFVLIKTPASPTPQNSIPGKGFNSISKRLELSYKKF